MDGATFRHRVDLIIQLIDTTTGLGVSDAGTLITKNGYGFDVLRRDGSFVAINVGREDFTLGIKARGYEECEVEVKYEDLDEALPIQLVFLTPKESVGNGEPILSLTGSLDGIESIEGVCVNRPYCSISDFDEKKLIMTVFRPQGILSMDNVFYGLIKGKESYERIEVTEKIGEAKVKLLAPIENGYSVNSPIAKVVFGTVKDNEYIFRVRDDANILQYLICYVVKGEKHFKLIDFHKPEEMSLT